MISEPGSVSHFKCSSRLEAPAGPVTLPGVTATNPTQTPAHRLHSMPIHRTPAREGGVDQSRFGDEARPLAVNDDLPQPALQR